MAFRRVVEMIAGTTQKGLVISDLYMTFDITRTRKFANNVAKFKIFNTKGDTINKVLKKGNSITFKAGYADEGIGLIYTGQITQSIPDTTPPNTIVSIECGSIQNADTSLSSITVSMAYKKGTAISRPLNEIGTALGLSQYGFENASGITLANGYNLSGTIKQALQYLQGVLERNGCGLFIDNTTLIVFKKGQGYSARAVSLTPATGLLGSPKLTDNKVEGEEDAEQISKRILFRSILNYKIVPNGNVFIKNKTVQGTYIVDKCSFKGDNFGGMFEVSGEGIVIVNSGDTVASQRQSRLILQ